MIDYNSAYQYITAQVLSYYGQSSDIWQRVSYGSATSAEIYEAYNQIPRVYIDQAINRKVLGYAYDNLLPTQSLAPVSENIVAGYDSNVLGAQYSNSYSVRIPATFSQNSQTGEYTAQSGSLNSSLQKVSTVADRVKLAYIGVNLGCKLGKAIDEGLYQLAPDWWDEHLPSVNPETWSNLCGQSETGDFFLRTLLNVTDDGTTAYISEEALAYYYQMLRDVGAFASDGYIATLDNRNALPSIFADISSINFGEATASYINRYSQVVTTFSIPGAYGISYVNGSNVIFTFYSNTPLQGTKTEYNPSTGVTTTTTISTVYWDNTYNTNTRFYRYNLSIQSANEHTVPPETTKAIGQEDRSLATYLFDGNITQQGGVDGITSMPESIQYPPTNITGTTPQQVLQQLKQEYPDLFNNSITETVMQEDGTLEDVNYVPMPWAVTDSEENPELAVTAETATQANLKIDAQDFVKQIDNEDAEKEGDKNPNTGTGIAPIPTIPTGSASSLWAVYNPSQSQLNSFGSWLWSSDLVDQIKRLFVDPMQAVIGVHKVFCNVPNGSSATIKCGYIDSGVSAPTVSSQYVQIDCGTVSVNEFYGNVFDYEPYTTIHAYLPFIGVVKLDTGDVMRGSVNITYGVDVITGACLAKIKVSRDGNSGILYSFGGSCAVHYPLSSGSYGGIISGIVSAAVGVGTSVITGNPLAAVGGIVSGAHQAHFDVSKSGGFTGASGATGPKKPYLIISRPQTSMARGFDTMTGYPANQLVQIKDCEGFIKCKETHIESNTATQEELNTIETMLKNGILI